MAQNKEQLSMLREIHSIMNRSSRFISLSGLSGIFAGIFALAGAFVVKLFLNRHNILFRDVYSFNKNEQVVVFLAVVAATVFTLAACSAVFFTILKAQKVKQPIWHSQGKRLLANFCIPLVIGGVFCLSLLNHNLISLLAPSMLVFYGLSLINCSKYTFSEIRYLGFCVTALGLISSFFIEFGFLFWTLGFGVLNIIYGAIVYFRYENELAFDS